MQVALSKKSPYLQTSHRVSGLMLANHTGVRHLFDRSIAQFDRLIKRKAFIDNYKVGLAWLTRLLLPSGTVRVRVRLDCGAPQSAPETTSISTL